MKFCKCFLPFHITLAVATLGSPYQLKTPSSIDLYACQAQVSTYCEHESCVCTGDAFIMMAGCLGNATETINLFINSCQQNYQIKVTMEECKSALEESTSPSSISSRPILIDSSLYKLSTENLMVNYNSSLYYSIALLGYWLFVGLAFALNSWSKFLLPCYFIRSKRSKLMMLIKKYITLPAVLGKNKQAELSSGFIKILLPSRLETVIILGYILSCGIFMGINIKVIENDPIFPSKVKALSKYLAVRSGIVATMNVPLLILFAGRNNFLQWVTGINFATFITFHKWISRIIVILVTIHSICYTVLYVPADLFEMKHQYYIFAIVGTASGCFIFFQSLLAVRRKWYDLFLIIHIVLAIFFMIGSCNHVYKLGYIWFIYVGILIWIVDRLIRLCRMFVFGFPLADLKLINSDTIKLQVPIPKWWKPTKGGFGYVYFVTQLSFFQSHPFSYVQLPKQINFYIKVKGGITDRIRKELVVSQNMSKILRVSVEGPYSGGLESCNIKHYHSSVFFAGGNGIPSMFSEAYQLANLDGKASGKSSIKLIWVIRDYTYLNWFYDELMLLQNTLIQMDIYVTRPESQMKGVVPYLEEQELKTCKSTTSYASSFLELEKDPKYNAKDEVIQERVHHSLKHIDFFHGRPSIKYIVETESRQTGDSIAFVTCGQPLMVDEMRREVSKVVECGKRVDFYEHLQVWL